MHYFFYVKREFSKRSFNKIFTWPNSRRHFPRRPRWCTRQRSTSLRLQAGPISCRFRPEARSFGSRLVWKIVNSNFSWKINILPALVSLLIVVEREGLHLENVVGLAQGVPTQVVILVDFWKLNLKKMQFQQPYRGKSLSPIIRVYRSPLNQNPVTYPLYSNFL